MLPSVFQTFIERSPICVMAQAVLENLFQPERLDELFERTAQRQYQRTLLFSSVVELLHSVVLGVEPTVYSAYRKRRHTPKVSDQAVYDKLDGHGTWLVGRFGGRFGTAGRGGHPCSGGAACALVAGLSRTYSRWQPSVRHRASPGGIAYHLGGTPARQGAGGFGTGDRTGNRRV